MNNWVILILYLVLAPIVGGLLTGLDRIVSARMQGRVGPPLLQPFYDVFKLFGKESISVNRQQNFYVVCFFIFIVFTGALFFEGKDLLLVIFALTLASIFLILGGYASNSPYSYIGAERELIQIMSYEPMVLITAIGMYMVTKSFAITDIIGAGLPAIIFMPGIFIGFVFILTIKLRKSPFDLSMSHHAHQELVKGLTTEFSGPTLALIEVAHWYENVFLLGFVYLFFAWSWQWSFIVAIVACLVVYLLEVFLDNSEARVKWQVAFKSSWLIAATLGVVNLVILYFIK
ncbi:MAG: NADH-quinone oxidoreductase subunit H [Vallitaleaceae bacterium]|nr:NADH-quinone oxidoreductase subunit H [Vallitaleaceae bacterium]